MSWFAALTTGFGLGLASFGALWLSVRQLVLQQRGRVLLVMSGLARLALLGVAFYAMSREGPDKLLAALAGVWLARWCLIRQARLS